MEETLLDPAINMVMQELWTCRMSLFLEASINVYVFYAREMIGISWLHTASCWIIISLSTL